MIGARELKLMKKDAILINTGRGGLVDEAALAEALTNKTIGGAGFDVLTVEPPEQGNILLDLRLPNSSSHRMSLGQAARPWHRRGLAGT